MSDKTDGVEKKAVERRGGASGAGFMPGKSGNPGGRPKGVAEVVEMARKHTAVAMQALVDIATDDTKPPAARATAAVALLERGWGKPVQPTMEQDENGKAVGRGLVVFAVNMPKVVE